MTDKKSTVGGIKTSIFMEFANTGTAVQKEVEINLSITQSAFKDYCRSKIYYCLRLLKGGKIS